MTPLEPASVDMPALRTIKYGAYDVSLKVGTGIAFVGALFMLAGYKIGTTAGRCCACCFAPCTCGASVVMAAFWEEDMEESRNEGRRS
ncbi:hypothetical protein VTO73DRAFT_1698 [Trametes versicolor]